MNLTASYCLPDLAIYFPLCEILNRFSRFVNMFLNLPGTPEFREAFWAMVFPPDRPTGLAVC